MLFHCLSFWPILSQNEFVLTYLICATSFKHKHDSLLVIKKMFTGSAVVHKRAQSCKFVWDTGFKLWSTWWPRDQVILHQDIKSLISIRVWQLGWDSAAGAWEELQRKRFKVTLCLLRRTWNVKISAGTHSLQWKIRKTYENRLNSSQVDQEQVIPQQRNLACIKFNLSRY